MSIKAVLKIDGKQFNLLEASYNFTRFVDLSGYGSSLVRFERITFLLPSYGDIFFLNWMFEPAMQKSGSISFYEDEDMIRKVKRVVFAGAFCVGFKEVYDAVSSMPMHTELTISAGGIKIEESIFRFPWFRGPFKSEVDEVVEEKVEYMGPPETQEIEKTVAVPQEPIQQITLTDPVKEVKDGNPVRLEDIGITEPVLMGKVDYLYYLYDKNTKATFATVTMPNDVTKGPELNIDTHDAELQNGRLIKLNADGFSWTPVALNIMIDVFRKTFGKEPETLPGGIIKSNLENFQKAYHAIRSSNEDLTPNEISKLAVEQTSFGFHRKNLGYDNFEVITKRNKDVKIDGVVYPSVPNNVEIIARRSIKN